MIKTRLVEDEFNKLFVIKKRFSENLIKREDNLLKDKYDFNAFECINPFTYQEFLAALKYQKDRKDNFIKFESYFPIKEHYGLEENVTLTMLLDNDLLNLNTNNNLIFKKPEIDELINIEIKHYGKLYGEDFCRNNIIRQYPLIEYIGAYLDNKMVGALYYFSFEDYTCLDGLIVDEDYRNRYIASSLINEVIERNKNNKIFLHAEDDDTPKLMYEKMGFKEVDKIYEYISTNIDDLKL